MSHVTPWADAEETAKALVKWIKKQDFSGDNNFTVAVYRENHLVISKVGGITLAAKAAKQIIAYIKSKSMQTDRKVYLAKSFASKDGPVSNHAEMCILAACGKGALSYIECTSPNCKFCKATLKAYGVNNANENGPDGKPQLGWRHPFLRASYGSALSSSESNQLTELAKINKAGKITELLSHGQNSTYDPKGDMVLVLNDTGDDDVSSDDESDGDEEMSDSDS